MAEEFKILLGAELKPDASKNIQDDINQIQSKINPIQVRLDDRLISQNVANITQQINGIRQNNPISIRLDNASVQRVRHQIDNIRQQIQALGNIRIDFGGGNNPRGVGNTATALQRAFRQTSDLYKKIKNMEQKVGNLGASGLDADNITLYNQQLNALRNTYNELVDALSGQNVNLDLVFTDINNATTAITTLSGVIDNARTKLATDIKININNGNLADQIRSVEHSFNSLDIVNDDVRNGIRELQNLLATMDSSDNVEYITAQYRNFQQVLIDVTNQVKELQRQHKAQIQVQRQQAQIQRETQRQQRQTKSNEVLESDKNTLDLSARVWLRDHSAAARQFGSEIQDLIVKIRACDNAGDLKILRNSLQDIQKRARLAGKDAQSLGDKLKKQFSEYSTYFSVASLMNYAEQAIRSMYNNVIELDSAMTDLMKVTDETADAYDRFLSNAGKSAQGLGRSVSSFVQQSANWAKMGFDTVDSAELAKISSIYSNVADVDDATAVSDIVTAMKAFNIEAKNAITIIDPMNKISNEFAVTAAGLGQGLSRAASTMATAGTDLEHTLALLTGIAEITQSPEEAGNFLKTAIARIQGMKGVLEELGEEVDESVDSISKVQTQILNLTHGEVNIFDDSGNFRDYYYIMQDIADIVDELKSTDRAQLYEILFGKNRMNQGAAMIQAFQSGRIEEALGAALGSEGSAMAEQEKWMESLEAKLGQLEAAWESLSKTVMSSDGLKWIIDRIIDLVNVLDIVIDKTGVINTAVAGIAIGKTIKNILSVSKTVGGLSSLGDVASLLSLAFPNAANSIGIFTSALSNGSSVAGVAKAAISGLWSVISAHPIVAAVGAVALLVTTFDKLYVSAEEANENMKNAFSVYEDAKQNVLDTNKELENTEARIDELQAKGGLTFVEQQELENLREATELLKIQADLAKEEEKRKAKEAADSVEQAYQKNNVKTINDRIEDAEYTGNNVLAADEKDVLSMIAFRTQMEKLRDEAQKLRDETELGSKEWDLYNYDVERYNKIIDDANNTMSKQTDALWEQMSVLVGYREKLEAVPYDELTNSQKELLNNINHTFDYVYKEFKPLKWKEMQFDKIFDNKSIAKAKSELVKLAAENKAVGITVEDIKNKYPELASIIESEFAKLDPDLGFTLKDFVDYINSEADILNVDVATDKIKESYAEAVSDATKDVKTETEVTFDPKVDVNESSLEEFNSWVDSLDQEDKVIVYDWVINQDALSKENIAAEADKIRSDIESELKSLQEGGAVSLLVRPTVDASALREANFENVADGIATVFSETFSNEAETIAMNFTPILPNGKVMEANEFREYCEGVVGGDHDDYLSLKIGATFEGEDAISQAETAASRISELHGMYFVDGISTIDIFNAKLTEYKNSLQSIEAPKFTEIINDEAFIGSIDVYIEKTGKLKDALDAIDSGEFTTTDRFELEKLFPQLAGSDNLSADIQSLISNLTGLSSVIDKNGNVVQEATGIMVVFENAFGRIDSEEDRKQLEAFMKTVLELGQVVGSTQFAIDISTETEGMENLWTAMKESVSSTGLTYESIRKLKYRYSELEKQGYDVAGMFERTENGIHLNTKALRELESAYEKQTKKKLDTQLNDLVKQYNDLTTQIDNTSDTAKRAELYAQRNDILDQINNVADLASRYEGLTSAFYKWEQAQSIGEEGDMYDSLAGSLENVKQLYDEGLIGTNKFRTAVQLMSNEDLSTASIEELLAAYETGYPKMQRYFTDSSDGCLNFLNDVQALNSEWVSMNEDGSWNINFGAGGDEEIAKALGINVESVQSILRKLSDYGFDINLDSMYSSLDLMKSEAEKAVEGVNKALESIGKTPVSFNFNTTDIDVVESQIKEAQTVFDTLAKNSDGTINLKAEGAEEAKQILTTLITQKQELNAPSIMSVDTTQAKSDIETTIALLKDYQTTYNNLEINTAVGADTSKLETDIQGKITEIEGLSPEIKASLGLNSEEFNAAIATIEANVEAGVKLDPIALATITATIAAITPEMMVTAGLDDSLIKGYKPPEKENVVKYKPIFESATPPTLYGTAIYRARVVGAPSLSATVDGTAHINGTAFAKGNWGTKDSGVALGGELGRETIVRDGRFFTIGDDGAEFFNYKKGDIIFNHKQTEELFKNGKVTSGNGRGKALANGTTFAEGNAFSRGSGSIIIGGQVTTTSSGGSSGSDSSSDEDEFKETFDWIEVAIDRIERAISSLDLKASSVYRSWSSRNQNLKDEISNVSEEIEIQQAGYERYLQEANSVGLSEHWAKLVRDGAIDIDTITDEELADKIGQYQEWYEKAIDCRDSIEELKETESELYQQAFDNIVTQYDGFLSVIEHERNMLEEYISQSEASGYIVSTRYYDALINVEKENIAKLEEEKESLLASLEEAVNSGTIEPDSEAWFEMVNKIDETTIAIEEANTSLIEFNNSIRDTEWEIFDLLQEQISQVAQESDFLIDLLSNDKLYDDRGRLTNEGMSTMGLHGMNYNVYMEQANQYAQEMLKINEQLADDPYNQELINRRQELLELQQESILSAESEKQAIVDMIEEGINLELEALQELIDSYAEALDSKKDLYDYQKKIKDQTEEIAILEKQMAAYSGDTSEESRSKIQEIKASLEEARENLEETEYEKYISDQKKLLDELYNEYELILNQRLDNIDALIQDMISEINVNSSIINDTLSLKADEVGYTLSDTMITTWGTTSTVLATYGEGIQNSISSATTSLISALETLSTNIQNMVSSLNSSSNSNISYVTTSSAAYSSQAKSNIYDASTAINASSSSTSSSSSKTSGSSSSSNKSSSSSNKSSSSSSSSSSSNKSSSSSSSSSSNKNVKSSNNDNIFDYKKDSYPKDKLNTETSVVDRLKYNNFDSSFSARSDYYKELGFSGTYTGSEKQNTQILNYLKKNGYRTGKYRLSKDELNWTQEGRNLEAIVRPSDGAILTPLAKDDSILKASATSNIFNFANDPNGFIRDVLNVGTSTSNVPSQSVVGNTYDNDFSIQIELPNVQNYEQFKYAMQHDKGFEKMVRAMTVDKMFGGSSLKKYKC